MKVTVKLGAPLSQIVGTAQVILSMPGGGSRNPPTLQTIATAFTPSRWRAGKCSSMR